MGQFNNKPASEVSVRIEYDEETENGIVFGDRYLPEELLEEIFCYMDYNSLLNCQLVCKRWNKLICDYIWRKKAEAVYGKLLPPYKDMFWPVYYLMCTKRIFERNLVRNHSGSRGVKKYWKVISDGGNGWTIENPPTGVPSLPDEPVFGKKQHCFVTSFANCTKIQMIDLRSAGFIPHILDDLQPPIVVSEWYSCRWDCPAVYQSVIQLLGEKNNVLDTIEFNKTIEGEDQNQWHCVSHEFQDYGPGLRKISFFHGGRDKSFWAGYYGAKMAGASVVVKFPVVVNTDTEEGEMSDVD